jgi:hypothetical protein
MARVVNFLGETCGFHDVWDAVALHPVRSTTADKQEFNPALLGAKPLTEQKRKNVFIV